MAMHTQQHSAANSVHEGNASSQRARTWLALIAFAAGGAVPIQLVTLSFGYAQYYRGIAKGPKLLSVAHEFASWYVPLVYIPALAVLLAIAWYSRTRYPGLYRRIVVGFSMGAVATLALDAVRQMGVINGWLPADTTVLFGKLVTGSSNFATFWPAGLLVHFLDGADFGLFFAFVWGKRNSFRSAALSAVSLALVVELLMMTGPPMGPMVGPFGIHYAWPGLFLDTLVAHVLFGLAFGLLIQNFLTDADRDWLFPFLFGRTGSIR